MWPPARDIRRAPAVLALCALLGAGCDSSAAPGPAAPVPAAVVVSINGSTCSPPPCFLLITAIGDIVPFTAAVLEQNGDTIIGVPITWSSSNTAVATVSGTGLVQAVERGTTEVSAHWGTLSSVPTPVGVTQEVGLLRKVLGDAQTGTPGDPLPMPITVQILDGNDQPIPGATVHFEVTQGGGSVSATSVVAAADGRAAVAWTLGPTAGAVQQVTARAARMQFDRHSTPPDYPEPDPVTFDATAMARIARPW